ncbi:hypothetical protein R3P38DRAFT_3049171 [Favolaschia claudopus]|uniref:Secreted protein n=1 Tax=Favolaschia claudopus TaxID=2862362 RepID=A0AAW0A6D3_9AGAR
MSHCFPMLLLFLLSNPCSKLVYILYHPARLFLVFFCLYTTYQPTHCICILILNSHSPTYKSIICILIHLYSSQ